MGIHSDCYAPPQGAFYLYADLKSHGVSDSLRLCEALLEEAGVAMTPGVDFEHPGSGLGETRVRFGFPGSTEDVIAAMAVLAEWWTSPAAMKMRGL
jgi:aspartate/methionine/tyrosine aminotransferase